MIREGKGTMQHKNGESYVGGFANDKKHGMGRF